jgi:gliding motility-associated lipoprotein GldH
MKAISFVTMFAFPMHRFLPVAAMVLLALTSCDTIDLYEKTVPLKDHQWQSSYKPEFRFTVKDSTQPYQLFVVLRHNEKYNWNNMWVNLEAEMPGAPKKVFKLELPLATNDKGWLGTAMDDIYEDRIPVTLDPSQFNFQRAGEYRFTLQHVMREDPLQHVMNVGLRIEKKPAGYGG